MNRGGKTAATSLAMSSWGSNTNARVWRHREGRLVADQALRPGAFRRRVRRLGFEPSRQQACESHETPRPRRQGGPAW